MRALWESDRGDGCGTRPQASFLFQVVLRRPGQRKLRGVWAAIQYVDVASCSWPEVLLAEVLWRLQAEAAFDRSMPALSDDVLASTVRTATEVLLETVFPPCGRSAGVHMPDV